MDDTTHRQSCTGIAVAHLLAGIAEAIQSGIMAALPHLLAAAGYLWAAWRPPARGGGQG